MSDGPDPPVGKSLLYVSADHAQIDLFSRRIENVTKRSVVVTETVNEGLGILDARDDIECIISDYDLPEVDGLAFLHSVRTQFPDYPFILFTSEGNEAVASKAITARVTDYLIKERIHDQWEELGRLIERAIRYHQSSDSLGDRETRAKVILEAVVDPTAIIQEDQFCYANRHALDLFEVDSLEALSDKSGSDLVSSETRAITTDALEAIQTGQTRVERIEQTIIGEEGTHTPVELTAVSIHWMGAPAILLIFRDVSDRKQRERELAKLRERYKNLFNSIRDAILVADTDRRIIDCNPAFTDLFGYELDEIQGKPMKYVYESDEQFEEMGEKIQQHYDDPMFSYTVSYKKKNGKVFPGETNVFYLRDENGEKTGFIGLIRDVTERENRLRQLKIIDRVLRHNIRNDMTVIDGRADLIRDNTTGRTKQNAHTIINTSNSLLNTAEKQKQITNMLVKTPKSVTIDMASSLRDIISSFRNQYPGANISLQCPKSCEITTYPEIERAIEELLENAVVHSDRDTPGVEVKVECRESSVNIQIADDGPEIPEMEQKVLTGEEEMGPLYHGSGLGLWFAYLVTDRTGGRLDFEPNEPRGNVVTIRISLE